MTWENFIALATFAFVTSITPGPNNMMLLASGANFGVRRTIPHMMGVALGFVIMTILVGLGLAGLFVAFPVIYTVLKVLSVAYLLYLAWKIATAASPEVANPTAKPLTFLQAALFQWVNPKAWTMALTAMTVYAASRDPLLVLAVASVFGLVNLPSVGLWAMLGEQMRKVLSSQRRLQIFNIGMALLLVASLYPTLAP